MVIAYLVMGAATTSTAPLRQQSEGSWCPLRT